MVSPTTSVARVARIDRIRVRFDQSSAETDPQTGFVRVWGQITPVGVLAYGEADGAPFDGWSELVPAETVFDEVANRTLLNAPITLQHPPDFLDATNTNRFQIGSIIDLKDDIDKMALRARHLLTDAPSIAEMRAGLLEISPGYTARVLGPPGFWQGQKYDAVQTERRYNHVAIVTAARAGPGNALDRVDAVRTLARCFRADGLRIQLIRPGETKMKTRKDAELTIGEDTFNVPEAVADAFRGMQSTIDERDRSIAEHTAAATKAKAESADQEGEEEGEEEAEGTDATKKDAKLTLAAIQKLIDKSRTDSVADVIKGLDERDKKVREDASALAAIIAQATPMLPQSFKMDGRKASEIMLAAITQSAPSLVQNAKDAIKADDMGRLRGTFDAARILRGTTDGPTAPKLDKADTTGGAMADAIARRKARIDASRNGVRFENGQPVLLSLLVSEQKGATS